MNVTDKKIKTCFWIFFFLLLTEGIFRRWIFPNFNNVFLVARDPFVLYAVILGLKRGYLKARIPKCFIIIGFLTFLTTLAFGHGNILVTIYGIRITMLYFPFCYICSYVLRREDILNIGKILVFMIVPMCTLNIVQFFSPQSSFVNIGVGGNEEGAGFGGAMGYFRPPGIFTFISGLTDYYAISFGFLLFFLFDKINAKKIGIGRFLLLAALIAYIISIPISISRTHFVQSFYVLAFALVISCKSTKAMSRIITLFVFLVVLIPILSLNEDLRLFLDVFFARFDSANESEGGLGASAFERTFGWASRAIEKAPLFGYGEGHFSNFGMKMIVGDVANWQGNLSNIADATEMEWGRIICEDGVILGGMILLLRFSLCLHVLKKSYKQLKITNDYLLWLLMPMTVYSVALFQLKASYNLGFMSLITVACLTLIRHPLNVKNMNHARKNCNYNQRMNKGDSFYCNKNN